jgi:Pentapeptide repeats (8 copies)
MAEQYHLQILKEGITNWNEWRQTHLEIKPDLSGADLSGANLPLINLAGANLHSANLSEADLQEADLSGANLRLANLHETILIGANLQGAILGGADLDGAKLREANFSGTSRLEYERERLRGRGAIGVDEVNVIAIATEPGKDGTPAVESISALHSRPKLKVAESTSILHLRINQEPLTAHNLAIIISTLTQLHPQCWLIATGRFADLVEYAQTRNPRFDEEANPTIAQLIHYSPAEIKFNVSLEGVAIALKTAIDAVLGMQVRKRELELQNKILEEEIARKKQETEADLTDRKIEQQKALVELYDKRIEVRRKELDLMDYATEKAPKIVDTLNPDADANTKAMAATTLIKSLLQLGEAKGLELLPPPQVDNSSQTKVQPPEDVGPLAVTS